MKWPPALPAATACAVFEMIAFPLHAEITDGPSLYAFSNLDLYGIGILFLVYWLIGFTFSTVLLWIMGVVRRIKNVPYSLWEYLLLGALVPVPFAYAYIELFAHAHGAIHIHFSSKELLGFFVHSGAGAMAAFAAWYFARDRAVSDA